MSSQREGKGDWRERDTGLEGKRGRERQRGGERIERTEMGVEIEGGNEKIRINDSFLRKRV